MNVICCLHVIVAFFYVRKISGVGALFEKSTIESNRQRRLSSITLTCETYVTTGSFFYVIDLGHVLVSALMCLEHGTRSKSVLYCKPRVHSSFEIHFRDNFREV